MPLINVDLSGDHAAVGRRVGTDRLPIVHTTRDWTVDPMEHGMESGATSIMLLIPATVPGSNEPLLIAAETSLQCWISAATVLAAKFADEVERPGWASLSPAARAHLLPRMHEAIRRAIPTATPEQLDDAANMVLDGFGADGPAIEWPT